MSDRALLQQALEALEDISNCYIGDHDTAGECARCHESSFLPHAADCKKKNAIDALRARLAQPERHDDVLAQIDRALEEVHSLCNGKRWVMRVPAQDDDPDLVIAGALQAAKNALAAPVVQQAAVPDGYVMVPREPTISMIQAVNAGTPMPGKERKIFSDRMLAEVYRTMIDAAEKPNG